MVSVAGVRDASYTRWGGMLSTRSGVSMHARNMSTRLRRENMPPIDYYSRSSGNAITS